MNVAGLMSMMMIMYSKKLNEGIGSQQSGVNLAPW